MSKAGTIRVFIVDDHQIVIDGLKSLLLSEDGFVVAGSTTNPLHVLEALEKIPVDVLITDIMMPGMDGVQLAASVRTAFPTIRILALSMNNDGQQVNELIETADLNGYVLKNTGKKELTTAVRKVYEGGIYFDDEVLHELKKETGRKRRLDDVQITTRELEIIRLLEKEMNTREIASQLFISERTVETHRKNILRKTGTNSVLGLIKFAYENKLL